MLKRIPLLSDIPDDRLALLEACCRKRKYPKNTILFMEGDSAGHLYIIESGMVCVYTEGEDGKQLILNYLSDGEYFGELALLDHNPRSASVVTQMECEITSISREDFSLFLKENPDLYESLMMQLVAKIRDLTNNVKDMALLDVYGRVAQTLERLSNDDGALKLPKLTHQEIANMVGASREMVSRIMKELVFGGYIEVNKKHIEIKRKFPKEW